MRSLRALVNNSGKSPRPCAAADTYAASTPDSPGFSADASPPWDTVNPMTAWPAAASLDYPIFPICRRGNDNGTGLICLQRPGGCFAQISFVPFSLQS